MSRQQPLDGHKPDKAPQTPEPVAPKQADTKPTILAPDKTAEAPECIVLPNCKINDEKQ
jgi:hypothetical protein